MVVGVEPDVGVDRHPRHPPSVALRPALRRGDHRRQIVGQPVDRPAAQSSMVARVGLLEPPVELELEVEVVGERASRLEVRLRVALQPLHFASQSPGSRIRQPHRSCPQKPASSGSDGRRRRASRLPGPTPASVAPRRTRAGSASFPTGCRPPPWRRSARPRRRGSTPARRSPHSPAGSGRGRPGSRGWAATNPTGRSPPGRYTVRW